MNFCAECGSKIIPNSNFCESCGLRLNNSGEQQTINVNPEKKELATYAILGMATAPGYYYYY